MKNKLQNLLKHNWRTLLLLFTLITTSQGAWAWDNCRIHGQFGSNKSWSTSDNIACNNSVSYDLSVGTYEFGVKSNNDTWLTIGAQTISSSVSGYLFYQGGSGNPTLNATVAGTYTFKCVACQNDGIKLDITFPHATIKGTFCSWSDQDLPYTVSLAANTSYEFGVTAINNSFYKNASITSANCTNVPLSTSGENATILTTYAGDYTFTWDDESKQISVTYPEPPTLVIVGEASGNWLNGHNWANSESSNVLTGDPLSITFNNVAQLTSNTSRFRIVQSGTWDTNIGWSQLDVAGSTLTNTTVSSYNEDNNIKINTTSTLNITVTYDGSYVRLFTEVPCTAPSVTTTSGASSVTNSRATLKGTVTITSGDCEVTDAGIAYGTSTSPTTPASYGVPTSGEAYSVDITDLSAGTRYYYRAYVTAGGVTTYGDEYSFYTNPTELYIKGPLVYDSKWDPYTQDNVGYSHTAGTNTFVFSFNARTGDGGTSDSREYCVSTTNADGGKIHSSMDGTTSGWSFKSSSGSNFVASSTIVSEDETPIEITITYNNNTGLYHMVLTGACSGAPTIDSDLSSSTTWSKCGNAEGRQLSITASGGSGTLTYQWFRNTTNTLTDGVADLTGATAVTDMVEGGNTYSPSASDYGKFYYCCVVRSGGACSANKATSVYTGEIEIKQTPTVKPSTITVKQYEPVRLQATNSSVNWSITTHPDGAAADEYYLYDETKNSAMFKGKTGSYTVTATSTGSDCTSTSAITVENDPNTCN